MQNKLKLVDLGNTQATINMNAGMRTSAAMCTLWVRLKGRSCADDTTRHWVICGQEGEEIPVVYGLSGCWARGGGAGRTRLVPLPRFRTGSHTGRSQMPVAGPREGHGANMGHEAWMGSASALYPPIMPRKWSRAHAHSHLIVHKGWETWAQSQDGERMQKNDSRKRFNRHFAVNSRTHVVEELIWRSF